MLSLILLAVPILLFFLRCSRNKKEKKTPLPGPIGLPFIGNLHQIDNTTPHIYLRKLAQKYGPLMSVRFGSVPILVVSSAKMAKMVMKDYDLIFCSRPALLGQQKLSYNGLDIALGPYNDYWREVRKVCVVNLFSSKKVQFFRPIREDEVSKMIRKVSKLSNSSKTVNLSEIVMSLTSTLICRIAFGKRYEDEENERRKFHELLNETQAMLGNFYFSDYFPLLSWVDKINGMCARLEKNFMDMDLFYQELINDHLSPDRPESMQDDFLDVLLRLKKDKLIPVDLTFDHIKGVLMNVLLGGTDTGASAVVWTMTMLMKNPKELKEVQAEVRELVGNKGIVEEDDIQKLPYLAAVIKETMRLYPPVPLLLPRETMDRCVLDVYEIPPKTMVYVNAWAIGRDSEVWENSEEFMPERFLGSTIDFRGQDFELIPFGAGRRGCPGLNMGIGTVELVLANLLYSFDWELPHGMKKEDIDYEVKPGVTMHKKNDLCLIARNYALYN